MSQLRLVVPSEEYLESYLEACRENVAYGVTTYELHDPAAFEIWRHTIFEEYARQGKAAFLRPGRVASTTFWSVMDGRFVGEGNLRHRLSAPLRRFGGHIGYMIRPSRWGQGLGTLQLALLLAQARARGIDPALVTCNVENRGSARVIERNGGRLVDVIPNYVAGRHIRTCRYWVPTSAE